MTHSAQFNAWYHEASDNAKKYIVTLEANNIKALKALGMFLSHVPELYGDEVRNGYITLEVSEYTIEKAIEAYNSI